MKVLKALGKNTIMLETEDGVIISVHSHWDGSCEIQFGGIEGKVIFTNPSSNEKIESGISGLVYANYTSRKKMK